MKETLGWLAFGLGLAFAVGQYLGLVQEAWFPHPGTNGFVSFFGFGLPMIVLGGLAAGLWTRREPRLYLGWTAIVIALIWGVSLLILVAGRAGLVPSRGEPRSPEEWFTLFLGFLVSMLVTGASGVTLLSEPAPKATEATVGSPLDDVLREVKANRARAE